jgi:hypothetical protein
MNQNEADVARRSQEVDPTFRGTVSIDDYFLNPSQDHQYQRLYARDEDWSWNTGCRRAPSRLTRPESEPPNSFLEIVRSTS